MSSPKNVLPNGANIIGQVRQNTNALSALNVDCSTGNYFTKLVPGSSTFTFSNVPEAGFMYAFTLKVITTGAWTLTWPPNVKWPGLTPPTLTSTRTHFFTFLTDDGGKNWYGNALVDYVSI
jgi:hypothetical protein